MILIKYMLLILTLFNVSYGRTCDEVEIVQNRLLVSFTDFEVTAVRVFNINEVGTVKFIKSNGRINGIHFSNGICTIVDEVNIDKFNKWYINK